MVALLVNAALFTAILWASELFVFAADSGGWVFARQGIVWNLSTRPIAAVVVALAGLALVALVVGRRPAALAPSWLVEGGSPVAWPAVARSSPTTIVAGGVAAGLAGVAVMIAYRLVEGAAGTDEEVIGRVMLFEWYAGAVAASCILVLALLRPGWGAAAGLLAAVISTAITTVGFVTLNVISGGPFHGDQLLFFGVPALCLAFFLSAAALLALAFLSGLLRRELPAAATVGPAGSRSRGGRRVRPSGPRLPRRQQSPGSPRRGRRPPRPRSRPRPSNAGSRTTSKGRQPISRPSSAASTAARPSSSGTAASIPTW